MSMQYKFFKYTKKDQTSVIYIYIYLLTNEKLEVGVLIATTKQ